MRIERSAHCGDRNVRVFSDLNLLATGPSTSASPIVEKIGQLKFQMLNKLWVPALVPFLIIGGYLKLKNVFGC